MTDTAIVWFRRDLRIHDHPSLTAAARSAERVVPVFVLDEALLDGRFASGPRIRFLLGCLRELREALRERGADLVVRSGDPVRELAALARETGAEELHFASDVSSSGDEVAFSAASTARLSPVPMPMPSSAFPASDMIVRTSAKSRLIRPGRVIRSEMPWTPWRSTSSATVKASIIDVCLSSTLSRRLFGTTMRVSTSSASASMPRSAACSRREPSKPNGFVTMPTVSAPSSRAIRATTGAAPVPVPPPSPAVMNTMSEPLRSDFVRS